MAFFIKKHCASGVGVDLFLQKEVELPMVIGVGSQVMWHQGNHTTVEVVREVIVDIDMQTVSLWVDGDLDLADVQRSKEEKLQILAAKTSAYLNQGWSLQK